MHWFFPLKGGDSGSGRNFLGAKVLGASRRPMGSTSPLQNWIVGGGGSVPPFAHPTLAWNPRQGLFFRLGVLCLLCAFEASGGRREPRRPAECTFHATVGPVGPRLAPAAWGNGGGRANGPQQGRQRTDSGRVQTSGAPTHPPAHTFAEGKIQCSIKHASKITQRYRNSLQYFWTGHGCLPLPKMTKNG